jgi:putative DNA primase/helicase
MTTRIANIVDRRALERNVLKTVLEDETFQRKTLLEDLVVETPDFQDLLLEIRRAVLGGQVFDFTSSTHLEGIVAEIIADGVVLNGEWSAAIERLKKQTFDRTTFPLTDLGNAERFAQECGARVRFDHLRGEWLIYDGHFWRVDRTGQALELMSHTIRGIYEDAKHLETESERKAVAKWAMLCESRAKLVDALALARNLPGIRALYTDFDRDPLLINCVNGTLDLRSQHFRPHLHTDLITKSLGTSYDGDATCPWFESDFLPTIFDNDAELIGFIQRSAALVLSGLVDEQFLWFLYGSGLNGKTSFVKILSMILGDYHQSAPSQMLLARKVGEGGANNDVARLQGARLVTCQEIDSGRRLAESQVKFLTGGDRLVARFLYGEFFQFEPSHKLWLVANHKPLITGTDVAIWRRVLLVPFKNPIPQAQRKPLTELMEQAQREASGILNWLIEGWVAYRRLGLEIPARVRLATDAYRDESDTVHQFLVECCADSGEVATTDLYNAFRDWSGSPMSQKAFFQAMVDRGYQVRSGTQRKRFWQGVGLLSERE